jgi:hypothetical protein
MFPEINEHRHQAPAEPHEKVSNKYAGRISIPCSKKCLMFELKTWIHPVIIRFVETSFWMSALQFAK